jgi:two-component system, OmpR family, phosphate regulon sensor histidine kinase PhoR
MIWRIFSFFLCQISLGALAWIFVAPDSAWTEVLLAALAGGYIWFVLDAWRANHLLGWIRRGGDGHLNLGSGVWAEVYDRMRRTLRSKDRLVNENKDRLNDFLAALQVSPNGVVLLDADGRIEWFNETACQHFGFDVKRDRLQHFGNLVRDPAFAAYYGARHFHEGVTMPGRQNSANKPVRLSVHIHPYGEGRSLLLSRDITALEQAEVMRRDFVANVSHEIRTPLTVLSGFVETLQVLPLNELERSRYLGLMSQQADRMQTLVNDLLTLSRLEGSPLPPSQDWIPVSALMEQCKQESFELSSLLNQQMHELHFQSDPGIEIAGSSVELYSALSNLVSNAIRYTPAEKPIEIHWLLDSDGDAVLSVKDHGQGIASEYLPRLTERFYRVDRSRSRDTGGTGLGLAIVKHVAQRHGATLRIESEPGKGSCFSIQFPATRVHVRQQVDAIAA